MFWAFTHHILPVHPSVHGHLGSFHILAVVKNAAMSEVYRYVLETQCSILLGAYPEVELLDHTVILRVFFFLGTTPLFCSILSFDVQFLH